MGLRQVEQLEDDRLILAEHFAGGDAEEQAVTDLAGSAGDGDAQPDLAVNDRCRQPGHALVEDEAADHVVVVLGPDDEDIGNRCVGNPVLAAR
ncbi:hypothetical protein SDC9_206293 [bioreactor metagenome]|uniref:Uncharacterized protein n=1 Tax=bioreactor metagenome TaxID=1076179 RepID=A0A645J559_9ZZZZ